jgi:hypothetical protein
MALSFSAGTVQWLTTDALSSTKVVTGLGFQPKAMRFYWVGLQSNQPTNAASAAVSERRGVGFAVGVADRRAVGTFSADNAAVADCGSVAVNDCICVTVDGAGTIDGKLDLSSFDANGFTLIVDDVTPANLTVFWEAWGGTDITVARVGDIAEPGGTGTQTYTVTGFANERNQCVMFAGVQSTAAVGTGQAQDSGLHVGFATGTGTRFQVTLCGNSDDGSDPMDTDGYIRGGECISMITVAGGNPSARAVLNGFGANSFSLNWAERATSNRRSIFLAIKGGAWEAGGTTIAGNTLNSTVTIPLPFQVKGISMITRNSAQSASDTSAVNDIICLGSAVSTTSRVSAGVFDEDAVGTSEINTTVQYNSVLSVPSGAGGVTAAYDINSLQYNSVQIITDTAGGVASTYLGYLAFGDTPYPRNLSVGHPHII